MGLDIHFVTDNQIPDGSLDGSWDELFYLHSLSRTFCNFMCQDGGGGAAELWQIGNLAGVDVTPLAEMQTYPDEEELEWRLETAASDVEKQQLLQKAEAAKANLAGNLPRVLTTIERLLSQLAQIENLPELLVMSDKRDVLNRSVYFANFIHDTGDGYIGNNFGQDLRNFRRFLEFARSYGSTTVYFEFG